MFRRLRITRLALLLFLSLPADAAYPHGGGLDANGGHYNRKTGEYHYHRPRSTTPSTSSNLSPAPTPRVDAVPDRVRPVPPPKPRGRIWYGPDGKRIAKGDPLTFDKVVCSMTIRDGVNPDQTVSLESLSVGDQAYVLDEFKANSKFHTRLLKWTSKSGAHSVRAMPLVAERESITLLKTDGRVVDVPLKQLDEPSQQTALTLFEAGERAKQLIASAEPNPFDGGDLSDGEVPVGDDESFVASPRL